MPARPVPQQILQRLKQWKKCFWFWNISHYALGLTATIGTVIIAAKPWDPPTDPNTTLGIVVAICTSILTFAKASSKSSCYIQAWRILDVERIAFQLDPDYPEPKLANALRTGEAIIGKTDD